MNGAICWGDLVMFRRGARDERGVLMMSMPGNKLGMRRADGSVVAASVDDLIGAADRSYFRPGHVVAAASDPGGQVGVVTGVSTALDVARFFDHDGRRERPAAATVASRGAWSPADLRRITELSLGDYVVSGPWLGRVVEVSLDVDVLFDDGALCRLTRAEHKLEGADKNHLIRYVDTDIIVFYPGQRVAGCPSPSVFKASRWIKGYWKPTRATGTVAKVDTGGVVVDWVASMHLGTSKKALFQASAPHAYQPSPHKLEIFRSTAAEPSHWCVGDRCFFRSQEQTAGHVGASPAHPQGACNQQGSAALLPLSTTTTDDHASSPALARGLKTSHGKRTRMGVKRTLRLEDQRHAELEQPVSVAGTRTTVDVLWQDGTRQRGVPSTSLFLFEALNEHDFIPGQHVVGRAPPSSDNAPAAVTDEPVARFGVVRSLNSKDQTVRVSWLKPATMMCPPGPGAMMEVDCCDETVSAYDLARNFDENFFYGDVVIHLRHAEIARDDDGGGSTEKPAQGSKKKPARGIKKKPAPAAAAHYLSWVGHIIDLCDDGHVQVKWGDGNISKVLPHEISIVKHQSVSEMLQEIGHDWIYDDGEFDEQQDMTQDSTTAIESHSIEGDADSSGGSDVEEGHEATRTTGRFRAIAWALIRLASEVFARGKRYLVNNDTATAVSEGSNGGRVDDDSTRDIKEEADGTNDDGQIRFRRFDVSQSPLDHHFLDNMEQGTAVGRKWTKRVQREWKILENDLPDAIYVRAFEDRMDLLRAVIVGASGTPYHDGLFFFDLHLPPSYPAEPLQVSYRSFGLHVNPNLYPSGTVCLSLLNTFGGNGVELWSPETSSLLQVIVSIQGLVLTPQPYYNEPAYSAQAGTALGRRNELPYSENTYLLTLQTMLHLLRRPPAGFEELVTGHFRRHGQRVLRVCDAYLAGCPVGILDNEARPTEGSREQPCSVGFKLALLNVVPRLVEAFAGIGAQGCKQFHKFLAPASTLQLPIR